MGRKNIERIDPELLLLAYRKGFFPMAEDGNGPISWYSPDPRAILDLDHFRISRSLRQVIGKGMYEIRLNTSFENVMRGCAHRQETWISEEIVESFVELHRRGFAHSVEAWAADGMAGGLYGVALGGAFFGESMFSRRRDASKVALVHLVERLRDRGFVLLDIQFLTEHLRRFGAREIGRKEYLARLRKALTLSCPFV